LKGAVGNTEKYGAYNWFLLCLVSGNIATRLTWQLHWQNA